MPEKTESKIPKPIGDVILGLMDPRTLSRNDFKSSSELLYHVTADRYFEFDESHDYIGKTHPNSYYSSTIGNGFYTTDKRSTASIILASRGVGAKVVELLPFAARLYDMRAEVDNSRNAPVTEKFFEDFRSFISEKIKADKVQRRGKSYYQELAEYLDNYRNVVCKDKYIPIDLRTLLGKGDITYSENTSFVFTEFMISLGYDGIIYMEGTDGDRADKINCVSIVFYNPKVLGTYDTWQQRKDED